MTDYYTSILFQILNRMIKVTCMIFEVFTTVNMKSTVLWDVKPSCLIALLRGYTRSHTRKKYSPKRAMSEIYIYN
jgi:hypothetical protein